MYQVKIDGKVVGYLYQKEDIKTYMAILSEKENIAFSDTKETVEIIPQLVSRNTKIEEEKIKNKLLENMEVQYTTYAITYDGKNKAYVSTMEEAEEVVEKLKKEVSSSKVQNLGILQVYADNLEEIKPEKLESAEEKVKKAIKKKNSTMKIARTNSTGTKSNYFTVKPINGTITSRFGGRRSPGGIGSTNHKGLDIAAKAGTTIKASGSGIVTFAGYKGSLGNLVIISNGKGIETYYGHCSKLYVKKGQKVTAGDKIAAVGQTGAATGPHLHFEVHVNGKAVNPQNYIY